MFEVAEATNGREDGRAKYRLPYWLTLPAFMASCLMWAAAPAHWHLRSQNVDVQSTGG
jgi:hypothetical protein